MGSKYHTKTTLVGPPSEVYLYGGTPLRGILIWWDPPQRYTYMVGPPSEVYLYGGTPLRGILTATPRVVRVNLKLQLGVCLQLLRGLTRKEGD